jgi:hypothetical protein
MPEEVAGAVCGVSRVLGSEGRALDPQIRGSMEARFGHDFSAVHVHTGAAASQSAQAVNALAYTVGRDIVFGGGQFTPHSPAGYRLLVHELTHVVQQSTEPERESQRAGGHGAEDDSEREARAAETAATRGNSARSLLRTPRRRARATPQPGTPVPSCPSGLKTVPVDLISLDGSSRDPVADLAFANKVFSQCCVQFSLGIGVTVDEELTREWLGGDTQLQQSNKCANPSGEEAAMFSGAIAGFGSNARIRAFYVESTTGGTGSAYSFSPYCAGGSGTEGMVVVPSRNAHDRSLAHEFGHILTTSGAHSEFSTNLMRPSDSAAGEALDRAQCYWIYADA